MFKHLQVILKMFPLLLFILSSRSLSQVSQLFHFSYCIFSGSEDSTVRLWHSNTYRLESTLNYGLERVWCVLAQKGTNTIAIGYDEGSVIVKLGRDEPAVSFLLCYTYFRTFSGQYGFLWKDRLG